MEKSSFMNSRTVLFADEWKKGGNCRCRHDEDGGKGGKAHFERGVLKKCFVKGEGRGARINPASRGAGRKRKIERFLKGADGPGVGLSLTKGREARWAHLAEELSLFRKMNLGNSVSGGRQPAGAARGNGYTGVCGEGSSF